jgi:drug/metabolite transporter (DMT)-like permease
VADSAQSINLLGVICGLGSALTYALYSIFGKVSLQRGYPVSTLILYVYGIGTIGLLTVALAGDVSALFSMGWNLGAWSLLLMLGTVQTLGTLALYTTGLRYLDAGVAGIVATFELVVAALLAFLVLQEPLSPAQTAGGALIAASVLLLGTGRAR